MEENQLEKRKAEERQRLDVMLDEAEQASKENRFFSPEESRELTSSRIRLRASKKEPNSETLQALDDIKANSNLLKHSSVEAMFTEWDSLEEGPENA